MTLHGGRFHCTVAVRVEVPGASSDKSCSRRVSFGVTRSDLGGDLGGKFGGDLGLGGSDKIGSEGSQDMMAEGDGNGVDKLAGGDRRQGEEASDGDGDIMKGEDRAQQKRALYDRAQPPVIA